MADTTMQTDQQQPPPHTPHPPQSVPERPQSQSPSGRRSKSPALSLDLSSLPPLITPSPPSNTLLITNLQDPAIFHPASLATIRSSILESTPLYSFSPLKSLRRIIVSFYDVASAVQLRQRLDGSEILGHRVRVFFGAETPIATGEEKDRLLALPAADKLFFISPPPSPPHGWQLRNEEPPNKEVHADDLAGALAKLQGRVAGGRVSAEGDAGEGMMVSPVSPGRREGEERRTRSGSTTVVYHPEHHGDSPALPAVMVEDTTGETDKMEEDDNDDDNDGGDWDGEKKIMAHTARPPVELMEH